MSVALNAARMVTRVGEKIENRTGVTWFPTKVLEAIDEAVQHLVIKQQEAREDYELDYIDVDVTVQRAAMLMRETGQQILEWQLPPFIHKIRRLENTTAGENAVEIPRIQLHQKDSRQDDRFGGAPIYWFYTQRGTVNTRVGFTANLTGVSTLRCWFIRRVAPLHYGTAQAPPNTTVNLASAAGQTALSVATTVGFAVGMRVRIDQGAATDEIGEILTITAGAPGFLNLVNNLVSTHAPAQTVRASNVVRFQAAALANNAVSAGRIKRQDDLYVGANIEITNDLPVPGGIIDATGVCRDYIAATRDAICDTDLVGTGATMDGTTTYAMIPQIEPEHHELVCLLAANRLAGEAGSQRVMEILGTQLSVLYDNFINALPERQQQTAQFVQHYEAEFDF